MNSGFSNLATLKAHLLGEAIREATEFDDVIAAIGLGMAALIERHCNRKFMRTVGDVVILPADRIHFLLPRFPIEAITAIDVKHSEADGWQAQTVNEFVQTIDLLTGLVYLPDGADPGEYTSQVRFTYTGGFWWNTFEENEAGYPGVLPAGATPLPDDLKLAWLMQCRAAWQAIDKLGINVAQAGNATSITNTLGDLQVLPIVKANLRRFVREEWV